jgi:UDP-2-acetamido-3-amino-2,3-dideoxy-glucuronate N-acetyltransferase
MIFQVWIWLVNLMHEQKVYKDAFVHESSYIDNNVKIGAGTKIWFFSHVQDNVTIGENCVLGQNVNISSNVMVGNNVKIQNNVSVYSGVELEDNVFCGPSCAFTNDISPRAAFPKNKTDYCKTYVKKGASIGANATIVCGHTIGSCALIGAGAVVTTDVPDYAVMAGAPAKQIGWICECGQMLKDGLTCSKCGRKYEKDGNGAIRERA